MSLVGSPWFYQAIAVGQSSPCSLSAHHGSLQGRCWRPKLSVFSAGSPWLSTRLLLAAKALRVVHCRPALALCGHRRRPKILCRSSSACLDSVWPSSATQDSALFIVGLPWLCMAIAGGPRFCVVHCWLALALCGHRRQPEVLHPSSSACPGSVWPSSAARGFASFVGQPRLCVAIVGTRAVLVLSLLDWCLWLAHASCIFRGVLRTDRAGRWLSPFFVVG